MSEAPPVERAGAPAATAAPDPDRLGLRPLLVLWGVVVVFGAITLARSAAVGIPIRDPHHGIFLIRLGISLALWPAIAVVDAVLRTGPGRPSLAATAAVLRRRWTPVRIALVGSGLVAFQLVYLCYHNLKSWDVFRAPQDAGLERVDHWLFFGHSPAVLLHDLLGQHLAAYVLMVVYESFSTVITIAFVAGLVMPDRIRDAYVYLTGFATVWILGVASYYAVPSLGPFQQAPGDFAGLPHMMIQDTQARYLAQRDQLLAHPHAVDGFAQISAFASLHVAVTGFTLLMAYYHGLRRTTAVLAVWVGGTVLATVYLGWHFAVDDVAGAAIAVTGVLVGRWVVHGRPGLRRPVADLPVPDRPVAD